jgi:outer membrane protein OmpA-like peptidoglycan-associated protein
MFMWPDGKADGGIAMKRLIFSIIMVSSVFMVHAQQGQQAQSGTMQIIFPAYSADLKQVSPEQAVDNLQVMTKVAELLLANPQYRVLVDGHANAVVNTRTEEMDTLRPLSLQRAEAAAAFLASYFRIESGRIILAGAGGGYPAKGSADSSQNRRVTFIIIQ